MAEVVSFPTDRARETTARSRLAAWLREIADDLDANEVVTDPVSALLVLTGPDRHETVCFGYGDDEDGLREAGYSAQAVIWPSFTTMGGNIRQRGDYQPKPMRRPNIVDGAFPAKRGDHHG